MAWSSLLEHCCQSHISVRVSDSAACVSSWIMQPMKGKQALNVAVCITLWLSEAGESRGSGGANQWVLSSG